MNRKGRLLLIPVPLDLGSDEQVPLDQVLPHKNLQIASSLSFWICENAKSTRSFLKRLNDLYPLKTAIQLQTLTELPRSAHKEGDHLSNPCDAQLLEPALQGHDVGLISEAGMPAIADPGSSIVRLAHRLQITVVPLVGPSAPFLALAASGMNGQSFAFWGYLPIEKNERIQSIQKLEQLSKQGQAQLFIEVPHRNAALYQTLIEQLQPHTYLTLASNLTQSNESIQSLRIQDWRLRACPIGKQHVTLYLIGQWPRH